MSSARQHLLPGTAKLDQAFAEYHRRNPQIYRAFVAATLKLIEAGRAHYGAKAVFEHLRYQSALRGEGEEWQLNNSYVSRYARLFRLDHPEHRDFFATRRLISREVEA